MNRIGCSVIFFSCLTMLVLAGTGCLAVPFGEKKDQRIYMPGNPASGRQAVKQSRTAFGFSTGDRPDLSADKIEKIMLAGADAVVRFSNTTITIGLESGVHQSVQTATTVLSEKGKDAGIIQAFYSRSEPLTSISASIYDAQGRLVQLVHEREFQDYSYEDQSSLFNDERYKIYDPAIADYPYTVVTVQESRVKNTLYLPEWKPQPDEGLSVEQSSLEVTVKKDMLLHFHQQYVSEPVVKQGKDGDVNYSWVIGNRQAYKIEPYGPGREEYMPHVLLSPDKFRIKGMSGSCSSWAVFGKWEYDNFLKNAAVLPQATINQVLELTSHTTDPKTRARLVYEYMQQKTHYVGVQVGIGGIKTEEAGQVDEKGYGDCKGLANYTRALLAVCGIKADYAEVYAGTRPGKVYPDFAALGFSNHIILCLPFATDTCWLECTSQDIPFNYEGDFTDNRQAVLITADGGKVVHTHKYADASNFRLQHAELKLDSGGDITGRLVTRFTGLEYEDRDGIKDLSVEKQVEKVKQIYGINRLEVTRATYTYTKIPEPFLTEKLDIEIPQFAELAGKSMLVAVNPFSRSERIAFSRHQRTRPLIILRGYRHIDSISYQLPTGYKAGELPSENLQTDFGEYSVRCRLSGTVLTCISTYLIRSGTWDAVRYEDFVRFHQQVNALDDIGVRVLPEK